MIYTTYFAMLKNLPSNITPISIARFNPDFYNGLEFKDLAPSARLLSFYKYDNNEEYYTRKFNEQLARLNASDVANRLYNLASNENIALVCFEKPDKFCHRRLVSKWFNDNGIYCKEFRKGDV